MHLVEGSRRRCLRQCSLRKSLRAWASRRFSSTCSQAWARTAFCRRKVGRRIAEELITSGAVYTARQLFDMGVVDVITAEGTGEAAVYAYIRKHAKSGNGRRAFERARAEVSPVTREELVRVVEVWADAALEIQDRDLRDDGTTSSCPTTR